MTSDELRDIIEDLSEQELLYHLKKYICMSLDGLNSNGIDIPEMLDTVYAECARRGKEWLYDKAYEAVCKKPSLCAVTMIDQVRSEKVKA